jgi:hypothetical protein
MQRMNKWVGHERSLQRDRRDLLCIPLNFERSVVFNLKERPGSHMAP